MYRRAPGAPLGAGVAAPALHQVAGLIERRTAGFGARPASRTMGNPDVVFGIDRDPDDVTTAQSLGRGPAVRIDPEAEPRSDWRRFESGADSLSLTGQLQPRRWPGRDRLTNHAGNLFLIFHQRNHSTFTGAHIRSPGASGESSQQGADR